MNIPPPLQKGDKIYFFSPCSYVEKNRVELFANELKKRGFQIIISPKTIHSKKNQYYFSATDEERIADFNEAIHRKDIQAIWCMRGGYGASRMVDKIDFKHLKKHPKWLIGFSDITLFQLHLWSRFQMSSLHALMSLFPKNGSKDDFKMTLNILQHSAKPLSIACKAKNLNHLGQTKGILLGGNLSLMIHTIGTKSEPNWDDKILFMEEVGEYLYAVERMLIQMKRRGVFSRIKGLLVGEFSQMKDTTPPLGKSLKQMILDVTQDDEYPIFFDFPSGHAERNYPLLQGGTYEIDISPSQSKLRLFLNPNI